MRKRFLIPIMCTAVLALFVGVVVGYAVMQQAEDNYQNSQVGYYIQHMHATSPPALKSDIDADMPFYEYKPDRNVEDITFENARYILGTDLGFVAVFYNNSTKKKPALRERTRTPASALPIDELQRLSAGIPIYSEEELVKLLQDYSS